MNQQDRETKGGSGTILYPRALEMGLDERKALVASALKIKAGDVYGYAFQRYADVFDRVRCDVAYEVAVGFFVVRMWDIEELDRFSCERLVGIRGFESVVSAVLYAKRCVLSVPRPELPASSVVVSQGVR